MSADARSGSVGEVLTTFLRLGCTSFGGPVAHLGYFHEEFVRRKRWIGEAAYADLVALCQFLPGPASSQVGLGIGWKRAGVPGAAAAWLGFTLPSAVLMLAFAFGFGVLGEHGLPGWVLGLKVAAVAVVAHALLGMAVKLCPDGKRAGIAILAANTMILVPAAWMQIAVILAGALLGLALLRPAASPPAPARGSPGRAWIWLVVFFGLLFGLPLLAEATGHPIARIASAFYRAGSLVFGGGHVVLPLLEQSTVESAWLTRDAFLAGYGAAQAMPGPLFAFSAYLGAMIDIGPGRVPGGLLALGAIYLPSALLVFGVLPWWDRIRARPAAQRALLGTNAAVVGLLGAAFHDPVVTAGIAGREHLVIAVSAFGLLEFTKTPPWLLVLLCAGAGAVFLG